MIIKNSLRKHKLHTNQNDKILIIAQNTLMFTSNNTIKFQQKFAKFRMGIRIQIFTRVIT